MKPEMFYPIRSDRGFRKKTLRHFILAGALLLSFSGCVTVTIPVDEYNLARAAMDGARESEAPRFSPGLWYKAEVAYREAERLYGERSYRQARKYFVEAKGFAEKAENSARIARFQSGDEAP